jgi:LmbE family N-acetylglucosaminyl deacetylase
MEIFIPDNRPEPVALSRVSHMGIGAHQDDLEIMSLDGILKCFRRDRMWYMGVTVTNGAGSPRDGFNADLTDEELQEVRRLEQRKAAVVGEYAACAQFMFSSADVKGVNSGAVVFELVSLLRRTRPKVVYTHNLADKHDTHVAVAKRVIEALRILPPAERPEKLYGCEVWRGLDWLCDEDKVVFDVTERSNISTSLISLFDSQVQGKRYDLAAAGRRRANATFLASHDNDATEEAVYGVDMSVLMHDPYADLAKFIGDYIDRFKDDVLKRVRKFGQN